MENPTTSPKNIELNDQQQKAVDCIDGPLLVLAGPGTGKTQLLSARVSNILQKTDTLPQNILCLTFTESAALNMRTRLLDIIGEAAYDVHISTYHAFASDIITRYPESFEKIDLETGKDSRMERPIDELTQLQTLKPIIDSLPFDSPLRSAKHYIKSLLSTISDIKQASLRPDDISKIANSNIALTATLQPELDQILSKHSRMPRKASEALQLFEQIHDVLQTHAQSYSLAAEGLAELEDALHQATQLESTKPLTAWKNSWLHKNESDQYTYTNSEVHQKLLALAAVYQTYQQTLEESGQYDFDDMILKTIDAITNQPELRYNLQEQYQYILLDEFQDTNKAQFQLVIALADHPVHEGRPNIMAVGDDDQGIFAFQGADISNMTSFLKSFRDVPVVNLTENYRSHHDILHVAHNIADQIESRLHHNIAGVTKTIQAASTYLPKKAEIAQHEFDSQAAEYGWIADKIAELITKKGVSPSEITVIAPRHAILEPLVTFLNKLSIPVSYEKRENILTTPHMQAIFLFAQLLQAIQNNHQEKASELFPRVLSLDFWNIPISDIWAINWQYASQWKSDRFTPWPELALKSETLHQPISFILQLALKVEQHPLEQVLDYITGAQPFTLEDGSEYLCPFKQFYFPAAAEHSQALNFIEIISHLSVLRSHLRAQQKTQDQLLTLNDLLLFFTTYEEAEQPLINTHPVLQSTSAVTLQTVYKSKGLEYAHVFLPAMNDQVWGSSARKNSNKIALPNNLEYVRLDSSNEDTRKRLLFVAMTRAKYGLYVTNHTFTDAGKSTLPVKYFQQTTEQDIRKNGVFPSHSAIIQPTKRDIMQIASDIETSWFTRHTYITPTLSSLLQQKLERYMMSPTHLNSFINLQYGGPQSFLLNTILRFPQAQSMSSIYGDALHRTLEIVQAEASAGKTMLEGALLTFRRIIESSYMPENDKKYCIDKGTHTLQSYLAFKGDYFKEHSAQIEVDFRFEGVTYHGARLTGKIDRLELDENNQTATIIDFKSGNPSKKWQNSITHLQYQQQLYFYRLLLEKSNSFKDYQVIGAKIEFIEPFQKDEIVQPLEQVFDQEHYDEFKKLLLAVWKHVQSLNFPNTESYQKTVGGSKQFIADLLAAKS
jgi:DNA helicase II / ATP-dependent DNA helicase PcrA